MAIRWNLKSYLAQKHQIYTVTDFQKLIVKKTGVVISVANLCKLVNAKPILIRLETAEIICSSLGCPLSEFLEVTPKIMDASRKKKLSFKNTPKVKIAVKSFPVPSDYEGN